MGTIRDFGPRENNIKDEGGKISASGLLPPDRAAVEIKLKDGVQNIVVGGNVSMDKVVRVSPVDRRILNIDV